MQGHRALKQIDVCLAIVVENMSTTDVLAPDALTLAQLTERAQQDLVVLITRRRAASVLGGYWELPGGKVDPGETHAQCLIRELLEEVGIEVAPLAALKPIEHHYEHAHVRLLPFICCRVRGIPAAIEVDEVRWVRPQTLSQYTFPPPNAPLIAQLARVLGPNAGLALAGWLQDAER